MNRIRQIVFGTSMMLLLVFVGTTIAGDFSLDWWTVDGGGDMVFCTGADFELSGTIGQPDAGYMTGGDFELTGGFWVIPAEPSCCPGDIDGDGDTDHSDLGVLLSCWGCCENDPCWNQGTPPCSEADSDGDGCVYHSDLGILLSDWGCGT